MLKYESYSRTWDKLDPSSNRLESFEEYCKIIERDGVHLGELEISGRRISRALSWSRKGTFSPPPGTLKKRSSLSFGTLPLTLIWHSQNVLMPKSTQTTTTRLCLAPCVASALGAGPAQLEGAPSRGEGVRSTLLQSMSKCRAA